MTLIGQLPQPVVHQPPVQTLPKPASGRGVSSGGGLFGSGGQLVGAQARAMYNSIISSSTTAINTSTSTTYYLQGGGGLISVSNPSLNVLSNYVKPKAATLDDPCELPEGVYKLPDGTIIEIDAKGNSKITDVKKRVTYRASPHLEFNPFVNASDLLAEFIRDLGGLGVTNDKIMRVPLDFYIHWLVVRAAQADGDTVQEHRCLTCGRFLHKDKWKVGACSGEHLLKFNKKERVAA